MRTELHRSLIRGQNRIGISVDELLLDAADFSVSVLASIPSSSRLFSQNPAKLPGMTAGGDTLLRRQDPSLFFSFFFILALFFFFTSGFQAVREIDVPCSVKSFHRVQNRRKTLGVNMFSA